MRQICYACLFFIFVGTSVIAAETEPATHVIVVVGAAGEPEFANDFDAAAKSWKTICEVANIDCEVIGLEQQSEVNDRDQLLKALAKWQELTAQDMAWLVLIGHGTAAKDGLRFNLRGPDIDDATISKALPIHQAGTTVICGFSASGDWLKSLSSKHRIVLTATQNSSEINYSRFAKYFADSIADASVDLDHDDETSLLEAFIAADYRTQQFYRDAGRLATEHALLDDNFDGKGTPATFFDALQPVSQSKDGSAVDGDHSRRVSLVASSANQSLTEAQRAQRDAIEQNIKTLKLLKTSLSEQEYYAQLEKLFLELANVYNEPAE